jgi:hypothetical protein
MDDHFEWRVYDLELDWTYGDAGLLKTETKAENLYMIVEFDWICARLLWNVPSSLFF